MIFRPGTPQSPSGPPATTLPARSPPRVAGTLRALLAVNSQGNAGGLAVQQHFDRSSVKAEAKEVVAGVPDDSARDVGDHLPIDPCFRATRMLVTVETLEQRRL